MKNIYDEKHPHRCGFGHMGTRGLKSRFSETKHRIKRWAKRKQRRLDEVQSRDE